MVYICKIRHFVIIVIVIVIVVVVVVVAVTDSSYSRIGVKAFVEKVGPNFTCDSPLGLPFCSSTKKCCLLKCSLYINHTIL